MKPFSAGWEELSPLERITIWIDQNNFEFGKNAPEYQRLMENFVISCENPRSHDYLNFQQDIRFYKPKHQELLKQGFFAMYNISPLLLAIRSFNVIDPERN